MSFRHPVTTGALDVNGTFTISGGTLMAVGSSGMAVAPHADSEQGWVVATFDSAYPAGTVVQIASGDERHRDAGRPDKNFSSVVFSSDAITSGESYTATSAARPAGTAVGGMTLEWLHVRGHRSSAP